MNAYIKKLKPLTYPQMIAIGFFLIIMLGAYLLTLPIASRNGMRVQFVDALFTATSATCVTGLVIFDTYTQWSVFGQIVILAMIQIGGLGFMTVITLFSLFLGRRIGLRERGLLRESVNTMYIGGIVLLFKKILIGTFLMEMIGAAVLSIRFIPQMGTAVGIYTAVFHSVSAFCNAGFDLMGRFGQYSSLVTYSGDAVVCIPIIVLIVVGGIGFFVWDDVVKHKYHVHKYQLHTKIVLTTTILLILGGTVAFYLFERTNLLAGRPFGEKILVSLFASITPRTAGFNTVNLTEMSEGSKLLSMILMFIGGSPGSTAGGIKTTTFAIMMISLWSSLRNTLGENVFGRQLEEHALKRASAVITVNLLLLLSATLLLCLAHPAISAIEALFESISAIGTVGLSLGVTTELGTFGRIVLVFLMYCGRVGSLTFALIFTEHRIPSIVQKPTEKINIG